MGIPEPGHPGTADSPVILKGKQGFQVFDARSPLRRSIEDVPFVDRDKSEGCREQKQGEHIGQIATAVQKSYGPMRHHSIRSFPKSEIGILRRKIRRNDRKVVLFPPSFLRP